MIGVGKAPRGLKSAREIKKEASIGTGKEAAEKVGKADSSRAEARSEWQK